jgi:hypothetical protein
MWAYKFIKKDTRLQVPSFWTFLKQNHDILKLWCEEVQEPPDERIIFPLRIIRFGTYFFLLFLIVTALIHPRDIYYTEECYKRTVCYTECSKSYFPEIACTESPITFKYNGNRYNNFFSYKRPDIKQGQSGLDKYQMCKGYIGSNTDYPFINHLGRQAHIHTCFSYCINGDDDNVIGETRPNCVDLPPD